MGKILALFILVTSFPAQALPQQEPASLFNQAYSDYSKGKFAEAEDLFFELLDGQYFLSDYVLYFLGMISYERGSLEEARGYFSELREGFPQSSRSPLGSLQTARIWMEEGKYQESLSELRRLHTGGTRRDIAEEALLLMGKAREAQGENEEAYATYQSLRKTSPLSAWTATARKNVQRLRREHPRLLGLNTEETMVEEASLLLKEREIDQAEAIYLELLSRKGNSLPAQLLTSLAQVYRAGRRRSKEASVLSELLRHYGDSPQAPEAMHRLAILFWNRNENLRALKLLRELKKKFPNSPWIPSAEFVSARIFESLGDMGAAVSHYESAAEKYQQMDVRDDAQWRLAWIYYRKGDHERAHTAFQRLAKSRNSGPYRMAGLYWLARTAEKMGKSEEAEEAYRELVNSNELNYYSTLAEKKLAGRELSIPAPKRNEDPEHSPGDFNFGSQIAFHLSRARELSSISLHRLALEELEEIRGFVRGNNALRKLLIEEFARNGAYDRSVRLASEIAPRSPGWKRYLYPLAYWDLIQGNAEEKGLDPFLVAAMIRQESLFDPEAVSPASAHGLMQLLPSTAARVAGRLGIQPPSREMLFEPQLNLKLGTQYLRELLEMFSDNWAQAIAAYNAGERAVSRWIRQLGTNDEEEFIERIPYGETRLYVKLVLRNYALYKKMYRQP